MVRFPVEAGRVIEAPANKVYGVLKDYKDGHCHIMPPQFFDEMNVLKGSGIGEGTRIEARFNVYGKKEVLIMDVSQPEPGRVLQEIDSKAVNITRFVVDPIDEDTCHVTIRTDVMKSTGLMANLDMCLKKFVMKRMYEEELQILNEFVQGNTTS